MRAKASGTSAVPRVSVFRSNKNIFAQLIDDGAGKTLVSSEIKSTAKPKGKSAKKQTKTEIASLAGEVLAKKAKDAGITKVVFDKGGYKYHGRVKALAEGLRKGGLKF